MPITFELWEKIFVQKKFDLSKNLHYITADEIKKISGAEPRIMAKMDSSMDLPDVFKRNDYFLLPVRNGKYAIVRGEGFHLLERIPEAGNHISRIKFHLTTAGRGSSEMQYLDYCFNSGALENVLGIAPLYQSIRGREFSKQFSFSVNQSQLEVASVQLEVDSGLEGQDSIILIEAKMDVPEDFIIRQLFYPYNHFRIVSPNKKIVPVFFTYVLASKIYTLWIYEFLDPKDYNSISLKGVHSFKIDTDHEIDLGDIKPQGVVQYKNLVPQANDLNKIIELVFKVDEGIDGYKGTADYFKFDTRQSSYYREATEALGLVNSVKGRYRLTDIGKHLVALPAEKRNIFMADLLCDFSLVKNSLDILKEKDQLTQSDIEKLISKESSLSGSTIRRRAASLMAWLKWISNTTGSFIFQENSFKTK